VGDPRLQLSNRRDNQFHPLRILVDGPEVLIPAAGEA
jgi:hypothetical protein